MIYTTGPVASVSATATPASDFWDDGDDLDLIVIPSGFLQIDLPPQIADAEWDFSEDHNDDYWWGSDDVAEPTLLLQALPDTDEPWDWTQEDDAGTVIPSGYQQNNLITQNFGFESVELDWADAADDDSTWIWVEDQSAQGLAPAPNPLLTLEDSWDWFIEIDDDEWTWRDTDILSQDALLIPGQIIEDPDFDEDVDDFFADDFCNDDVYLPYASDDAWYEWSLDGIDDVDWSLDEFLNISSIATRLSPEDAFDHFVTDDDEYHIPDDSQNASVAKLTDDPWEHTLTDDDEYVGWDDNYALIGNTGSYDDAWDWWLTDEDEYAISDDTLGANSISPILIVQDIWDHFTTDEDETWTLDEVLSLNLNLQVNVSDGWDYFTPDDIDDFATFDEQLGTNVNSITAPADGWDWVFDDLADSQDDADWIALASDYAYITGPSPSVLLTVEDAWDWAIEEEFLEPEPWLSADQDPTIATVPPNGILNLEDAFIVEVFDDVEAATDETWWITGPSEFLSTNNVFVNPLLNVEDGFDHLREDVDDDESWIFGDTNQIITPLIPQAYDDAWDWDTENFIEDNEIDWALTDSALAPSAYAFNPAFEVFICARAFTVSWIPHVET